MRERTGRGIGRWRAPGQRPLTASLPAAPRALGRRTGLLSAAVAVVLAGGCHGGSSGTRQRVVVYTSVDQVFSAPVLRHCEQATGLQVQAAYDTEETKSTGLLNRLLAEAKHPQADLFWSNDPVRPFVLARRGLLARYRPRGADRLPPAFRSEEGLWTGLAARARVLLVNTDRVPAEATPSSVRDLIDPRWRGQVAIANPLFGTTTVHVAALFTVWGEAQGRRFLKQLRGNQVRIASSNGEVRRLVASGEVAFGLTDTDDAFEALRGGAHVRIVYPDQDGMGTLVMPTMVVLIRGGPHPEAARKLADCLVSPEVERRLAEHGAHMPLMGGVAVPKGVRRVQELRAMRVDYRAVAEEMERIEPWLRDWVGL